MLGLKLNHVSKRGHCWVLGRWEPHCKKLSMGQFHFMVMSLRNPSFRYRWLPDSTFLCTWLIGNPGDFYEFSSAPLFSSSFKRLVTKVFLRMKSPWHRYHWTLLMISQHCSAKGLVPSGKVGPDLHRHMVLLWHDELVVENVSPIILYVEKLNPSISPVVLSRHSNTNRVFSDYYDMSST